MTNERKIIVITLLAIVGIATWTLMHYGNKPKDVVREEIIRVGTAAEFPNFEFIEDGQIVGFDIDLINAIADRLHKNIEIVDLPFTTLIQQLQMGALDILISGITPTAERAKQVLFTDAYTDGDPLLILAPKGATSFATFDDLKGKTVIVNDGFSAEMQLSQYPDINLKRLPTVADAFLALRSGQADAFVTARSTVYPFFEQYSKDDYMISEVPDTDERAAIAITQDNEELRDSINTALRSLKEDGTVDQLKKKWKVGVQ